jgi:protein TonB
LRRAAEAPGKSTPEPVAATETSNANDGLITPTPRPTPKENWPTAATVPSGLGTANQSAVSQRTQSHSGAAAAAPAREVFPSKIQTIQPEPPEVGTPAPTRAKEREKNKEVESKPTRLIVDDSTVTSLNISETSSTEEFDQQDESDSGGSKRTPLIAVAVILLAVAGYFGWAKMHSGDAPPAVQQQTSPAQTEPAPQAVVSGTPVTSATATLGTSPHSSTETATPANGKPSPAKSPSGSSSTILDVTPVEAEKGPEAIVVKTAPTQSATPKPATQEPEQAPAPESLGVTSTASQKAISGIASATPINVPKQTPQTMKVSQGVLQGMLVKKVQPLYPPQAQQRRIQGSVVMQATIGKDGSITNVKVLSGDSQLAQAATDAVRQWKYKPYVLNGEPVEIQSQVTVNFKLP